MSDSQDDYEKGLEAYKAKNYDEAAGYFDKEANRIIEMKELANQNISKALYNMGERYNKKEKNSLDDLIELEDKEIQNYLNDEYSEHGPFLPNPVKAYKYFDLAFKLGCLDAKAKLMAVEEKMGVREITREEQIAKAKKEMVEFLAKLLK